jgi:GTP pyrophosphokinase
MCDKAFRKHRLNFNTLLKSEEMGKVVEHFGFKTREDLIANVGYGKITPLQIVRRFLPKSEAEKDDESIFNKIISRVRKKKPKTGVVVKGIDDVLVKFGKCCKPVPGDLIKGYITRGFGVTVHRLHCVNILKTSPERQIEVEWIKDTAEKFPVKIHIHSYDRVGLLADVAASISKNEANIINANSKTSENKTFEIFFTITVEDTDHLKRVLSDIKKVKLVQEVKRIG